MSKYTVEFEAGNMLGYESDLLLKEGDSVIVPKRGPWDGSEEQGTIVCRGCSYGGPRRRILRRAPLYEYATDSGALIRAHSLAAAVSAAGLPEPRVITFVREVPCLATWEVTFEDGFTETIFAASATRALFATIGRRTVVKLERVSA